MINLLFLIVLSAVNVRYYSTQAGKTEQNDQAIEISLSDVLLKTHWNVLFHFDAIQVANGHSILALRILLFVLLDEIMSNSIK